MGFFPSWPCRKRPGRPLLPLLWLVGLLFVPVLGIVPPAAEETAAAAEGDVTVEDGVLSVKVREARLGDVLRAIAERTGLRFKLAGDLGSPVTAWFAFPEARPSATIGPGLRNHLGNIG